MEGKGRGDVYSDRRFAGIYVAFVPAVIHAIVAARVVVVDMPCQYIGQGLASEDI
ncbi:MAG: hypothetical protein JWL77_5179 [Chthonomonadaceae bacterium]|nr:hypothetical protein [Chthonomonadaceae bacterium]